MPQHRTEVAHAVILKLCSLATIDSDQAVAGMTEKQPIDAKCKMGSQQAPSGHRKFIKSAFTGQQAIVVRQRVGHRSRFHSACPAHQGHLPVLLVPKARHCVGFQGVQQIADVIPGGQIRVVPQR